MSSKDKSLRSLRDTWPRVLLAIAMGVATGAVFNWLTLPLPWMLGPMVSTAVAAMLRAPVAAPGPLRPYVVVVIGVMLGSGFSPDFLNQIGLWLVSFAFLAVYLVICGLVTVPYYKYVAGYDTPTAYFAGMPGGLSEMMIVGEEMGADDRAIVLAHASRIIIVVALVAIWFRVIQGIDLSDRSGFGTSFKDIPAIELGLLLAAGVAGFFLGRKLRLPAPTLLGPMLISAAVHLTGLSTNPPPQELVIAAQVLLGTIIGGRFIGVPPRKIAAALGFSAGATTLLLCITFAFAVLLYRLLGQSLEQVVLAFSPGGLAEMSLVAVAMEADIAYVASHHLVRISLIVALAPLVFRWIAGRTR
ncbi:AbrB family transcriptional regulator [Cognatishimia sp. F0-27]|uniref:AbrB family transcriptional regulator n=1 Tax=Cognatishimia sp. F0-27 TaxID=2816855 RepID=UPI001D0C2F55|nr:AbrB family transcriptional regulator [Cognatishimia sp. F0-27]MCC1494551.1 AbrB family transcriptional regulator [Cognatishimia sp. F0-27]